MSIQVAMQGTVLEGPTVVEVEHGAGAVTVFMFGDAQFGEYEGQTLALDRVPSCEVVCRGTAAGTAARILKAGNPVVVVGRLIVRLGLGSDNDLGLVRLSVEAESIGLDLSSATQSLK